jgi:hypothetical protein
MYRWLEVVTPLGREGEGGMSLGVLLLLPQWRHRQKKNLAVNSRK